MINGYKPNGYLITTDGAGNKIEGETRQCVHCQKMWTYRPGTGITRGWCLRCNGFICAEQPCIEQQKMLTDQWLAATGKTRSCIPIEEWNNRRIDKFAHKLPLEPELTITDAGVIVPRSVVT